MSALLYSASSQHEETEETDMTLAERYHWAYGFAALVTTLAYLGWLGIQLTHTPAAEVAFVRPLLWTLFASFGIHTAGRTLAAAAVRACYAEDDGDADDSSPEGDIRDERDQAIDRRADAVSFQLFSVLAAVPFVGGLLDLEQFWTTNALFLAFAVTAVFGVALRAVYYRAGIV